MRNAETKLAEWHRLYLELGKAQSALVEQVLGSSEDAQELRAKIAELQRQSELALQALHAAVAAAKDAGSAASRRVDIGTADPARGTTPLGPT